MNDQRLPAVEAAPGALAIAADIRAGRTSARAVMSACLDRILALDGALRSFVDVDAEGAMAAAWAADRSGRDAPLKGVPFAVKDTIDAAGLICSYGTPIHATRRPTVDADSVSALRRAGAIVVGTTHSTEYAIARSGPTRNPYDHTRTSGGSSSGSGAAVGAGLVPLALATQTLGSIMRPASYCGVYGFKATHSRLSTGGMMPLCASFDHVGPMARSVGDIALSYLAMLGRAAVAQDWLAPAGPVEVLRITDPYGDRMEPATVAALDRAERALVAAGHSVRRASLPARFGKLEKVFKDIVFHAMAQNHGADADAHPDLISSVFAAVVAHGRGVSDEALAAAIEEADYMRGYLGTLLRGQTLILTPSTDGTAPLFGELTGSQMLQSLWSLSGAPALAVPAGMDEGLPVGVTLVAAPNRERFLLSVADGLVIA